MTSKNINALLDIVRDEELELLRQKLEIHEGTFTFKERPALAFLDPYAGVRTFRVHKAYTYDENGHVTLNIEGTYSRSGEEAPISFEDLSVIHGCNSILTGEIMRLCLQIPDKYVDPKTVEEGWKTLDGEHAVSNWDGTPARVAFIADRKTIEAETKDSEGRFTKNEADEMVFDTMKRIKDGLTTAESVQMLFNTLDLDLPF